MLFYIALVAFIILASLLLAWRSMKDYQDKPKAQGYGIYLVRNHAAISEEFLKKIYHLSKLKDIQSKVNPLLVSFEKLLKGKTLSLIMYAPLQYFEKLPELHLLELEDYTQKIDQSQLLCFEVGRYKKMAVDYSKINPFDKIHLEDDEYLFLQLVSSSDTGVQMQQGFQVTLRLAISAKDAARRVEISKLVEENMKSQLGLSAETKKRSSRKVFDGFKARSLIPREVNRLLVSGQAVVALLKV